jgi:hypothetical protein
MANALGCFSGVPGRKSASAFAWLQRANVSLDGQFMQIVVGRALEEVGRVYDRAGSMGPRNRPFLQPFG